MQAVVEQIIETTGELYQAAPIVIVGTGPVGIRLVQALLRRNPDAAVVIYGDEPWEPYNRVRLSLLLSGEIKEENISNKPVIPATARVVQHHNCAVFAIDRDERSVIDAAGRHQSYSTLILATGSRPHIPDIPGTHLAGVFTFRNMTDAQQLQARRIRSRRVVVIGGGLLGLEAARAMQRQHTDVVVIEHTSHLMNRQLDGESSELLREHIMKVGVRVLLNESVKEIMGSYQVKGIRLRSGKVIECDTVIISTGIKPNIELARDACLSVGRGVRVNDYMQTTDPCIYAVGECAEHRDHVYGLVAPGIEQAEVAAHCILGGHSRYNGSIAATNLKVVNMSIFSMGLINKEDSSKDLQEVIYKGKEQGIYRKLMLHRGRLMGAIAAGVWDEQTRIQEVISKQGRIWPWQLKRFRRLGVLWPDVEDKSVAGWPAGATVCNCTGVTRGELSQAINSGCKTLSALKSCTGASTVCGSCESLLTEMLGSQVTRQAVFAGKTLLGLSSGLLLIMLVALLFGPIPYAQSVGVIIPWDNLWRDGLFKQISGFTLLGLSLIGLLIALRKRWKWISFGDFAIWRLFHVVLGVLIIIGLFLHTGFRFGSHLNLYLITGFVVLLALGTMAGGVIAVEHRLDQVLARRMRSCLIWAHILLVWPMPVLLGFHIVKSYYF
jgi:nitrite reductase (NADH) large subunit